MGQKQLSPAMMANRIASHGIINGHVDEENKFSIGGLPFSIYIRPKTTTDTIDVVLACKLFQEDDRDATPAPFPIYDWSPLAITELTLTAGVLSAYDIYWGSGYYVKSE